MTGVVRVGMFLPRDVNSASTEVVKEVLGRMDDAGLDHVGVADHVSFHTGWGQDGLIEATALAMLNERLPVYVGVYLLALRHPVTVARELAQFAVRAPGRLTLGVGVGGEDRHEIEVCGIDPRTRGRRTDECLAILRGLAGGAALSFDGAFYQLEAARVIPAPEPRIPLIVGGRDARALRRAGRFGDGWLGIWSTPEKYGEWLRTVDAEAAAAGRTDFARDHGLQLWCGFGESETTAREAVGAAMENMYRLPSERFERFTPAGTAETIAAYLRPYVEAGCRTFNVAAQAVRWEAAVEGLAEVRRLLNA